MFGSENKPVRQFQAPPEYDVKIIGGKIKIIYKNNDRSNENKKPTQINQTNIEKNETNGGIEKNSDILEVKNLHQAPRPYDAKIVAGKMQITYRDEIDKMAKDNVSKILNPTSDIPKHSRTTKPIETKTDLNKKDDERNATMKEQQHIDKKADSPKNTAE